ncbi:MAG: carbon storage regulator [Candidatus Anaerobiospirillum pullicola]|uniref:Translational regulator CsrA n=1 Tax=Candidatus Anaerobiospirillum pullicola TaxID=2838451 RepID=A0A948WYV2_9GAMM|nr:carbon storage regulator [Candidatus Anaerobiospirillum pullicola]
MLVISQKKGDKLHIGRDITISIIDLRSNKVRLGIEAPAKYTVLRDSLFLQEQDEAKEEEAATELDSEAKACAPSEKDEQ